MEAALFIADLFVMLLLIVWSVSRERSATKLSHMSLFDYKPGAECDDLAKPKPKFEAFS